MTEQPRKTALVVSSSSSVDYLDLELPDFMFIIRQIIYIDDKPLHDVVDFDYEEFLGWMRRHKGMAHKTTGSSSNDVAELLLLLMDRGFTDVLFITQSKLLSTTNETVSEMTSFMGNQLKIEVFDSGTFSASELPFIFTAARLIKKGATLSEIVGVLQLMRENTDMYVLPNDIGHIIRQGRVGVIAGWVASWMDIKPILRVRLGKVEVVAKIRKAENALKYFRSLLGDMFLDKNTMGVGLFSGDSTFSNSIRELVNPEHIKCVVHVTPGILAHFGMDSVAVGVFRDTDRYLPADFDFSF